MSHTLTFYILESLNVFYADLNFGGAFCCKSGVLELACEYGVIIKELSNYLIDGKVSSDKHEAEWYMLENDGIQSLIR